eukprot:CAMPEP_0198197366 /NCGR_PEP_ID=MMETSP1445-20131203/991_1 /TAXON_ID=36898 /ORGANISM="Pyramimonas sp., Strain CCMP2087" /LENGTH=163 /DNA_ID=CAMNT_0043866637 /DNA_START=319 /DNA_END=811 /DNA_ORIENTATION=-
MRPELYVGLVRLVVFYFFLELDAGPPPTGHHVLLAQMASLAEWDVRVILAELFRIGFRVIQGAQYEPDGSTPNRTTTLAYLAPPWVHPDVPLHDGPVEDVEQHTEHGVTPKDDDGIWEPLRTANISAALLSMMKTCGSHSGTKLLMYPNTSSMAVLDSSETMK